MIRKHQEGSGRDLLGEHESRAQVHPWAIHKESLFLRGQESKFYKGKEFLLRCTPPAFVSKEFPRENPGNILLTCIMDINLVLAAILFVMLLKGSLFHLLLLVLNYYCFLDISLVLFSQFRACFTFSCKRKKAPSTKPICRPTKTLMSNNCDFVGLLSR